MPILKPVDFGFPPINEKVWKYANSTFYKNTNRPPSIKDKEIFTLMILEAYEYYFEAKNRSINVYHSRAVQDEKEINRLKQKYENKESIK